jgi:antitoxin VapB
MAKHLRANLKPVAPLEYGPLMTRDASATRTKGFDGGGTQDPRLPDDVTVAPGLEEPVAIHADARRRLVPSDAVWDDFFSEPGVDLGERAQPALPMAQE